ncbi:MAG: J domain-containing protein [Chloroflexota bacterium]
MKPERIPDPYRALGVPRGATDAQVKAAHRRLAKRWHPDTPDGDTTRFLAIQEAYHLLMDPLRRRAWDDAHAAAPVRASEPGRAARPTHPGSGRTRGAGRAAREARARARAPPPPADPPSGGPWTDADRAPGMRTGQWSAAGVPWWEDFRPRSGTEGGGDTADATHGGGGAGAGAGGARPGPRAAPGPAGAADAHAKPTAPASPADDPDVYSRSSGAAWSMAARRHFRKGDEELARGGAFRRRGSGYVLGAEARRLAAEEAAEAEAILRSRAPGPPPARTAFDEATRGPAAGAAPPPAAATTARAGTATPPAAATAPRGGAAGASTAAPPVPAPAAARPASPPPTARAATAAPTAAVGGSVRTAPAATPTATPAGRAADPATSAHGSLLGRVRRLFRTG